MVDKWKDMYNEVVNSTDLDNDEDVVRETSARLEEQALNEEYPKTQIVEVIIENESQIDKLIPFLEIERIKYKVR